MRMRLLASFGVFLVLSGTRVFAKANVNQNSGTWLYVDAVNGNDGNSGNSSAPFRTIQAAVDNADRTGGGVTIIVNPGVYRENVTIQNHGSKCPSDASGGRNWNSRDCRFGDHDWMEAAERHDLHDLLAL